MILTSKTVVRFLKWLFQYVIGTEKAKRSVKLTIENRQEMLSIKRSYQKLFSSMKDKKYV